MAGKGTGINGRITKSDILSYIDKARARARVLLQEGWQRESRQAHAPGWSVQHPHP